MNTINLLAFLFISLFLFPFNRGLEFTESAPHPVCKQDQKSEITATANLVFKSADGGQTWQDISKGLPVPVEDNYGISRNVFCADENGFYLAAGNGIYHNYPNSIIPFWKKEVSPDEHSSIAPGKARMFAYNYWGGIFQKANGTDVWSPVFTNFKEKSIRSVFETAGGTIFIGTDGGLFKSTNSGKTWKYIHVAASNMTEWNGVLVATNTKGIIRSTDNGETWAVVISEGGVGINVASIQGGFAAITFNTTSNTRRIRTSFDDGKTWQPIDDGLQVKTYISPLDKRMSQVETSDSTWHPNYNELPDLAFISSIVQVGNNYFCGHPGGIFRSSNKGKSWELLLPSIKNKVFNLYVSGSVIYAIPRNKGC